ncbi:hypothetical protein ACXNAL_01050 [Kluyvera ascorbata]
MVKRPVIAIAVLACSFSAFAFDYCTEIGQMQGYKVDPVTGQISQTSLIMERTQFIVSGDYVVKRELNMNGDILSETEGGVYKKIDDSHLALIDHAAPEQKTATAIEIWTFFPDGKVGMMSSVSQYKFATGERKPLASQSIFTGKYKNCKWKG